MPAASPQTGLSGVSALILAGGLGTRLRPVVSDKPKALAPVAGRPFLAHLLDQLALAGLRAAVLCTGHMAEQVESALGQRHGPLRLLYSRETSPLGTGGALRLALPLIASDPVLALNGNSYCDVDLPAFWRWHGESRAQASLCLCRVDDVSRYGQVHAAPDGRVIRFAEKGAASGPGWINAGVYLFSRQRLQAIPPGRPVSLERDVLPLWVEQGLHAYPCPGRFIDIGAPESYAQAQTFFAPHCSHPSHASPSPLSPATGRPFAT